MKNFVQWILLIGGLYFLYKKFASENKGMVKALPPIQKKTNIVMND